MIKKSALREKVKHLGQKIGGKDSTLVEVQQMIKKQLVDFSLDEEDSTISITPYHLSFFYLNKIKNEKAKGQFSTPKYLADYLVKNSLNIFSERQIGKQNLSDFCKNISCADIACGTGNLIMALLYALKNNTQSSHLLLYFIINNLYGYDIDQEVLMLCLIRIYCFIDRHIAKKGIKITEKDLESVENHFQQCNILIDKETENDLPSSDNFFHELPPELKEQKYDLIIENPPFMIYGLRNSQNYKNSFKKYLRERFEVAEYKLPLYPIFMQRSIELLKKDGILTIITPDSYLLGRYYSKIRKYILEKASIAEITLLDFEPFHNVTLGRTVLTFLSREKKQHNSFIAKWYDNSEDFLNKQGEQLMNIQNDLQLNHLQRFQLFFTDEDKIYVQNWFNNTSKKLEDIVTIHTGIRSKIGQKNIISKKKKGPSWSKGIVSSKQIIPYKTVYQDHYIDLNPTSLWSGGYKKEIIKQPKLLIRQTGDSIYACYDDQGLYHLNNCHSISSKTPKVNLKALAVQLNSVEFNKLYHILSMEKGRTLAQVDIDFLLKMPYIQLTKEQEKKLANYYNEQTHKDLVHLKKSRTYLSNLLEKEWITKKYIL